MDIQQKSLLLFLLMQFLAPIVYAQDNTFYLNAQVLDATTRNPVAYCHVFNESKRQGGISDSTGQLHIQVSIGDTLAFMSMSYLGRSYIVRESDKDQSPRINLEPRYYEIEELEFAMPRTYKGFQEKFLEIEPENDGPMKELPKYNPYITPKLLDTNYINSASFKIFHPVSGLYYKNSKIEQSKRKVRQLQEQQLHQPEVDIKYNKEMVMRETGFTGDTLMNFMLYCNFSFNYLYEASQLDIIVEIKNKKEKFIEHCYGQCIPVTVPKRNKKNRR